MKLASVSILALLVLAASAVAQTNESYHTTLFGKLNPPGNSGGRFSALWGYTAPDGREYALLGGFNGTHIIDITESPIVEVAFIAGPANGWREMKTNGRYAYVVSEGGHGLQIIDLANLPASATLVREDTRYFTTAHTISQEGNFIYVHGTGADGGVNGGTIIFDVSTSPTLPVKVGVWADRYAHDAIIRNDTMWVAAINDGQLDAVYLGDRTSPRQVANIVYPGAGTHNADLTTDGHYVMTTDEIGSTTKTLKIWDVSNINNIRKVADYTHNVNEIIHNVQTKGNLAVISWYTGGTRIIDISNPLDPVEVGYYDTFPGTANTYAGNWATYPYFPSGKIISSDMQTGLYVFTFDGARRGTISGVVRDASTSEPIPFAVVQLSALGRSVTADAQGRYRIAGASDTLQYHAIGVDHFAADGSLILTEAGTTLDIMLQPMTFATISVTAIDDEDSTPLNAFAWRAMSMIGGGATSGVVASSSATFRILPDGTTRLRIGAWGYRPVTVDVSSATPAVEVRLEHAYVDDVELPLGWSLNAPTDDAIEGRWEQGVPIGTSFRDTLVQPGDDHTPDFGNQAFITQIARTDPGVVGSSDIDNGSTTLTSPLMDLNHFDEPVISVWLWYSRDRYPSAPSTNDTMFVSMSNDSGSTWKVVEKITTTNASWKEYRYTVSQYLTPTDRVLFRVKASDLDVQSWVEAGVDDFQVLGTWLSGVEDESDASASVVTVRPNPFRTVANISVVAVSAIADASLELFDALGRRVATIHSGDIAAGTSVFQVDAAMLSAGSYTWRLSASSSTPISGSMTVVR